MKQPEEIRNSVFNIRDTEDFNALALRIFHFQYHTNPIYRRFVELLQVNPKDIVDWQEIPFLPISFFKDHKIISGTDHKYDRIFRSSGTTGTIPSLHYIRDVTLYEESFTRAFKFFYGDPAEFRFLALLPGYLERQDSSLIYMMDYMIRLTEGNGSGFFLQDTDNLAKQIRQNNFSPERTILFGASFALVDFAEKSPFESSKLIVMETGGMKGRREEMIREELHGLLCKRLSVEKIHSEYGMTELLSQSYSKGDGRFCSPPWMKILIRDVNDPLDFVTTDQTGGINVIDLANLYSCSFIATQDLGKIHEDGSFEVLGRFDDSDIRGCNLLVVQV